MGMLDGRVVLVTGGSRGIGEGIVRCLAAEGASVFFTYASRGDLADALVADLGADRVARAPAALGAREAVMAAWEAAVAWRGRVDVLVNNAGIRTFVPWDAPDDEFEAKWLETYRVNALAPAHLARRAIAHWRARDYPGIVINVSSRPAYRGDYPEYLHDGASKGALSSMTYALARHFGKHGISAFVVVPGLIKSDMLDEYFETHDPKPLLAEIPLGEPGTAEDIGNVVAFLASGRARYSSGSTIDVAGASYIH